MKPRRKSQGEVWGQGDKPFFRSFTVLLIALFILKCTVSLHVWLPVYNLPYIYRATPEFLFVLLLLGLTARFRAQKWILPLAAVVCCALFVLSLGEGTTQYLYRRSLNPAVDLSFFPEFIRLLFESKQGVFIAVYMAAFCVVLGMIFTAVIFLLRFVVLALRKSRRPGALFWVLFALFMTTWFIPVRFADPGNMLALRIARSMMGSRERLAALEEGETEPSIGKEPDRYRNVLLFIVESYGYTAFAKEDHWNILKPRFDEFQQRLDQDGFHVVSTFLRSPVIGGYSWYADSTLLTGLRISEEQQYKELLQSDTPNIVGILNDRDYVTVLSAPGTLKPWPEGEVFYRFDQYVYNVDFDYRGPEFSFVPVPDQYSIHRVHNRFVSGAGDSPLFIEYMLVSSHAPFNRIPTYVKDWNSLGDGSIYHELPVQMYKNTWFQGKEYTEGYTAAITYVVEVIVSYLTTFIHDDTLVVIIGDHQPKYPVTERGQPLSVPVHMLSRDSEILDRLAEFGYESGLKPEKPPPHEGSERFFSHFMEMLPHL
jgi:hypothetical protein